MDKTIAVRMQAEIVYVSGTVNGVEAQWQRYQGNVWRTEAPRSERGTYEIQITGWDELGRASTYTTTLQYGFAAVTDRTRADVVYRTKKGFYNADDLNRVGHAVEYLTDLLGEYGYSAPTRPRTDWRPGDIPREADMRVYLGNVQALMDCYTVLPSTPEPPESMRKLGYQGANAIEQILVDMNFLIINMTAAWCYSGEIYAGEV